MARVEAVWRNAREQASLFQIYRQTGDVKIRNRLVLLNDRLVWQIARREAELCNVEAEELQQIGQMGLIWAVETFDPGKGFAFSSYAVPKIRGAMQHFLRDHGWDLVKVSRRNLEYRSRVKKAKRRLLADGYREIELDEVAIARSQGLSRAKWREVSESTARKPLVHIDDAHHVAAETDELPLLWAEVRRELSALPNPYRSTLMDVYFKGMSEAKIARANGVTLQVVNDWIVEGMRRLKLSSLADRREA
ncbi:sigma-70 family RNA polymerase sigma factor [Leptolyngbya sp. AN02str]|uniref:sigma-70 family RNA polymerase sigma factor n=1 Tax=Leptolyngbya sp. AN02str TaxID=3423363 RepID=UPI003D312757